MMPDLGRYALEVASAYAASLVIIGGLVGYYLSRDDRMRRDLEATERRQERSDG